MSQQGGSRVESSPSRVTSGNLPILISSKPDTRLSSVPDCKRARKDCASEPIDDRDADTHLL